MTARKSQRAAKSKSQSEREARAEPTTVTQEQASVQQFPAESSRARVWELHLRGMSKVRIAAAVSLNRETVAKIIQRCYAEIAPERKVSPARKLDAAVARWRLVQEQAWADHDADDERERSVLALSLAQARQASDVQDVQDAKARHSSQSNVSIRYQSQRSQYLRIILDAEKEIARLEGLYEGILDVDGGAVFRIQKLSQSDVAALSAANRHALPAASNPAGGES
jgi:hypothetical protein